MTSLSAGSSKKAAFLLFGGSGLVGRYIHEQLKTQGHRVVRPRSRECDIADNQAVADIFRQTRPDFVIHSAAYVSTEGCESDQDRAKQINVQGTENIAAASGEMDIPLLYLGSDYIFDGTSNSYNEDATPNPLNFYGQTKLEGENIVRRLPKHYVVRASVIFGQGTNNIVNQIVNLSEKRKIPTDKIRRPTYSKDLADAIYLLFEKKAAYGIYHVSNQGHCSSFELAQEILTLLQKPKDLVEPVLLDDLPNPTQTAKRLVLDNRNWRRAGLPPLRPYHEALIEYLAQDLRTMPQPK
ncbi:MAG: dTDP-4-dehydrorhamnose reductase [Candidatus Saganbacteria bacterium]|nr:dTDP-4-dehydrorhamnose reductase [Candidatus Saganbacteria bacterium]